MKRKDGFGRLYDTEMTEDGTLFTTYYDKRGKELYTQVEYAYEMPDPDGPTEYYRGPWSNSDDVGGGDPYEEW